MNQRHEVKALKALLVDFNKLLIYPAPGESDLLPVEIHIDPDIIDHLGYFKKHSSLADKIKEILDSWKADQHPYMSYEVKQLISEIESILELKAELPSIQDEPMGKEGSL